MTSGTRTPPVGPAAAGRRVAASLRVDLGLQARNGLLLFTGFSLALLVVLVRTVVPTAALRDALPVLLFLFVGATGFLFAAAQVLFERGERTLEALAVTPLRTGEYVLSKAVTLGALATLEGTLLLVLSYGVTAEFLALFTGIVLQSLLSCLAGLVVVAYYRSATNFLITSPVFLAPFFVPAVTLVGVPTYAIFYAWPTMPALVLFHGALHGLGAAAAAYAILYGTVAVGAAFVGARVSFDRHVFRVERR